MTAMLRTLLVDDEPIARSRLRALCGALDDVEIVGEAATGVEALARIASDSPDLVLLDIAMPDLDGMGVARAIAQMPGKAAIVFCTAFPAYALEAFEAEAIDYLLKPINRERLARAVDRARIWQAAAEPKTTTTPDRLWLDHLWVPYRDGMVRIEIEHVEQIEAEGDYVRFLIGDLSYLVHESLSRLADRLDPERFVRVRRSLIVRTDGIREVRHLGGGAWQLSLANEKSVRVGATYWKNLRSRLRA